MLLMEESYNDILAAVITGNASQEQQSSFNNLLQTDTSFRQLYEQLKAAYHQPDQTPFFDADKAFEKMKKRLGR
jgi:hypothetical protein